MSEKVPFLDLGATYRELQPQLDDAYRRVMASGWYLLGEELEAFEAEFATYVGSRLCAGVASGLDALVLGQRNAAHNPRVEGAHIGLVIDIGLAGSPFLEDAVEILNGVIVHVAAGQQFCNELIDLQSLWSPSESRP